jgi:hypothetical protein
VLVGCHSLRFLEVGPAAERAVRAPAEGRQLAT